MHIQKSYPLASLREIFEGVQHARAEFPCINVNDEKLREIVNHISRALVMEGCDYVEAYARALKSNHIPAEGPVRSAYKAAIAKINALRRKEKATRKRRIASSSSYPIATADIGPLTEEEFLSERALYGFDKDTDPIL